MTESTPQLELDLGMLTVEQQERVDSFKRQQVRNADRVTTNNKRVEELLLSGGFQLGIDFVNDFKCETVTETRSFGYGENRFEAEVTSTNVTGGCSLITDYFDSRENKMVVRTKHRLSCTGDKLECSTITSQYRAYKPATLLKKLEEYNSDQKDRFASANKTKTILNYTIDKYKKLFPNATVEEGTDYRKRGRGYDYIEFPIVYVKFESGSWLSFRIGHEVDREYTHKKFNRATSEMTSMAVLEMFNNQEAIK
jgi:hypothetical protein